VHPPLRLDAQAHPPQLRTPSQVPPTLNHPPFWARRALLMPRGPARRTQVPAPTGGRGCCPGTSSGCARPARMRRISACSPPFFPPRPSPLPPRSSGSDMCACCAPPRRSVRRCASDLRGWAAASAAKVARPSADALEAALIPPPLYLPRTRRTSAATPRFAQQNPRREMPEMSRKIPSPSPPASAPSLDVGLTEPAGTTAHGKNT
jgi:hypothetical protein